MDLKTLFAIATAAHLHICHSRNSIDPGQALRGQPIGASINVC